MPWFVEEVFGCQSLDEELKVPPVKYGPPNGRTMVVSLGDRIVAGGAWRRMSGTADAPPGLHGKGALAAATRNRAPGSMGKVTSDTSQSSTPESTLSRPS